MCVKKSAGTLLDLYEKSTAVITGLIEETACLCEGGSGKAQAEMISHLRRSLAMFAGMRKKDFDGTMEWVLTPIRERERDVREAIQSLRSEENSMVHELREMISGKPAEYFDQKRREFINRQRMREMEVARLLMELHLEKAELDAALKRLVAMGKRLRVRDFKVTISVVKSRQDEKIREAEALLDEFENARGEVLVQWKKIFATYKKTSLNM